MLSEGFDTLLNQGKKSVRSEVVHAEDERLHVSVINGDTRVIVPFDKPSEDVAVQLTSVDSLINYINEEACGGEGGEANPNIRVFVGEGRIVANFAHGKHRVDYAEVSIDYSPEMSSLKNDMLDGAGVGQRSFWELLIGELHGCFDNALLASIGQIKVAASRQSDVKINDTGLMSGSEHNAVTVTYPGKKNDATEDAIIGVDWDFKARMYSAYDAEYTMPMRLMLDLRDSGIRYSFIALGLDRIERQVQSDIVSVLRDNTGDHVLVYEGRPGSI